MIAKNKDYISRKNKKKAREYFGITGKPNLVLHHKDPNWKTNNIDRYIQWNPEDLIVMTRAEHNSLHNKGKKRKPFTEEHRRRIGDASRGRKLPVVSEANRHRVISKETSEKLSKGTKGKHWYNNGVISIRAFDCPDGFVKGRL